MEHNGYALVLGGGGAKGVYHLGVWQALMELGIKIEAVVGSSVGAIIAGFIAQDDYDTAMHLLKDIGIDKIVDIPEQLVSDGKIVINTKNIKYLKKLHSAFLKNKGLDTHPLRNILKTYINEKKIRSRGMDFGITTYQIQDLKPREIFIEDIENGLIVDYILASATLPGFSLTEIKKKKFIDGGIYNNIPYRMAKERGYKKIIVIDISGMGWNKRPEITGTETIYIKNSINMGGILNFDKKFLSEYRMLGYLDTLKVFGKINGIDYFYHADKNLYKKLTKLLFNPAITGVTTHRGKSSVGDNSLNRNSASKQNDVSHQPDSENIDFLIIQHIKALLPREMSHNKAFIYSFAECAAWCLAIEKLHLYTFKDFLKAIWDKYCEVEIRIAELKKRLSAKTIKEWIKNIVYLSKQADINELLETPLYEYDRVLETLFSLNKVKLPFPTLELFYPQLTAARLFFKILSHLFFTGSHTVPSPTRNS